MVVGWVGWKGDYWGEHLAATMVDELVYYLAELMVVSLVEL